MVLAEAVLAVVAGASGAAGGAEPDRRNWVIGSNFGSASAARAGWPRWGGAGGAVGSLAIDRQAKNRGVLDQFGEDAARADDEMKTDRRVARDAEDQFADRVRHHGLDKHGITDC